MKAKSFEKINYDIEYMERMGKRIKNELKEEFEENIKKVEKNISTIKKTASVFLTILLVLSYVWSISFGSETNLGKAIIVIFGFLGLAIITILLGYYFDEM